MTLSKTFNLSEPQFPHLSSGGRRIEWELNEIKQVKYLVHSEYSGAVYLTLRSQALGDSSGCMSGHDVDELSGDGGQMHIF